MLKHLTALALILIPLLVIAPIGCADQDPATHHQVQQLKSRGKVAVQREANRNALSQAHGKNSPVTHPIAHANNIVKELHTPLLIIAIVSFGLWAVQVGLSFTPYLFLCGFKPVFRWVWILSLTALFALPLLPLGIYISIAVVVGLFVYEFVKDKGNACQAFEDTETRLGFVRSTQNSNGAVTLTVTPKNLPLETAGLRK